MIEPDTKNWTWVLARPCPECGFDASSCRREDVPSLLRESALAWQDLLARGAIRAGRPNEQTWSPLEYACHVRDVFVRFEARIALMLEEDDPLFANWDQDATAVEEHYEEQDPATVIAALAIAADSLAAQLARVRPEEAARPGRRGDGSAFSVDSISRYLVHDPIHHLYDVSGRRASG